MTDLIDRQAAIDAMTTTLFHYPIECLRNINKYEFAKGLAELGLKSVPSAQPESALITWLLDEIWDDDQWELNCGAFPELLCRKLVKLGYVREKGGEYERSDRQTGGD